MGEVSNQGANEREITHQSGSIQVFNDLISFSKALETETGLTFDLASVIELQTDFIKASEQYLLLNIKEYGSEKPDNLLFLSENKSYAFSSNYPSISVIKTFEEIFTKPFGKSTVLCFLVLDKIMDNHKKQFEGFVDKIRKQEEVFHHVEYRNLSLEMEHFSDRLEEFHDLLLELQERQYIQMNTRYLTFDYPVLIAESQSLQGRCRRRIGSLKEVRQEYEMRSTEELNQRILNLNDVVKRLTALTVIFMLPTLIASHFGMNFVHMPELRSAWAYPSVIMCQVLLMGVGIITFRKIGWL